MNPNSTVINLFVSFATLLPGDPTDCVDPNDVNDESCSGGLASVASFIRHSQQRGDGPAVHIPQLDRMSKFVQMHPLGWGVNKLISHDRFGWNAFFATPSLFSAHGDRDLSNLQTHEFSPLLTNIDLPPMSSWFHYHQSIHFDYKTATSYIQIESENLPLAVPAVESLVASLDYVADLNVKFGCFDTGNLLNDGLVADKGDSLNSRWTVLESRCWSSIVFFEMEKGPYEECLEAALNHPHPPLIFYAVGEHGEESSPATIVNNTIIYHPSDSNEILSQLRVEVGPYDVSKKRPITHMAYSEVDLQSIPLEFKDATHVEDQKYLREIADQAITNDPVVGMSGYMPFTRVDNWRMCMGGECPIGNLFTDALRWDSEADFAVESSGGLRGPGWDEGAVRISDIWAALPFVNFPCTGVMSGVSVFQLLKYSTAVATFESTYTPMGDRLLQMSGMRITYNTLVNGTGPGRLMSVEIWDKSAQDYLPLDGSKMYRFATTSWMCDHFDPYPLLFGSESKVDRDRNVQSIVSEFLAGLKEPYDTSIQGRLVNDTEAFTPLNFSEAPVQSSGDPSPVSIGGIMLGFLGGLLVAFTILFAVHHQKQKQIIQSQQNKINQNARLLEQKDKELAFHLGTSKFGDAVNFIDSLLETDNPQVGPNDMDKLILIKSCLIRGSDDRTMYVPNNLSESYRDLFLLKEFAGVNKHRGMEQQPRRSTTANFLKLTSIEQSLSSPIEDAQECLKEFTSLDVGKQAILFELLSFSNLRQWRFNIFDITAIDETNTLLFVAWSILFSPHSQFAMAKKLGKTNEEEEFEGYDFVGMKLGVDMRTLVDYLRVIQRDYNDTPYHNAIHAADVVQTIHSLIQMAGENLFDKKDIFIIILAAVVHDVKHPGFNNSFQVNSFSNLALAHNDTAVLENEHASHAFKLLVKGIPGEYENLNFLSYWDISEFGKFRRKVLSAVLHTEMSNHFSTVAKMKNLAAGKPWDEIDSKLRWEILSFMLHLADISNPAKDDPLFELWADRCLAEFFHQGDKEVELGLPISLNCCRSETKKPDSQIGFINFIVKPSYEVLGDLFSAVGKVTLPILQKNLMYWEDQKRNDETTQYYHQS